MHLLKPDPVGFCSRPVEHLRRFGLSVSAYLFFPFEQGEHGHLLAEASMWEFLGQEMETPLIDEGVFKRTPEFLVHGYAYPSADHHGAVAAQARFAGKKKTVLAFGDRYWDGRQPSAPAAFERMPLHWSRAYGGEDYPINRLGKGRATVDGIRPLPNLELPHSRIQGPSDEVIPAGLSALDCMHPQRFAFRGTYDDNWLKEHSPGLPPDADWKYFNLAPRDQWLDAPLVGDEPFEFQNMHPSLPVVQGCLPGFKVRVFMNQQRVRRDDDHLAFREVAMQLTTLWFFPHAQRAVAIFQGLCRTLEDDASDVRHALAAVERIGDVPRTDAYYLEQFQKRTEGKRAGIVSLSGAALLPPGLDTRDPGMEAKQANFEFHGFKEDAQHRRACADILVARQQARQRGTDPDALGIQVPKKEQPPSIEALPEYLDQVEQEQKEREFQTLDRIVTQLEKALAARKKGELTPEMIDRRGPPTFNARVEHHRQVEAASQRGITLDRKDLHQKLVLAELSGRERYRKSAHDQLPAHRLATPMAQARREEIRWLAQSGHKTLKGMDLTGADLSNLDLRGLDFSDCWLESVDFQGSNLSRAKFDSTVLAHARFSNTVAVGASFIHANLGRALLSQSVFARSCLDHAILTGTEIVDCDLRWSRLERTNVLESTWLRVDLSECTAIDVVFHKLAFEQCLFASAQLSGCLFLQCELGSCGFHGARLDGASLMECTAVGTQFPHASLDKAVLGADSDFSGANFEQASLRGANLGGTKLANADFAFSDLAGANLTRTELTKARLHGASLKQALLRKSDLRAAIATQADFKDAILQGARIEGGDFSDSHFFGADLSRVELDRSTRLDRAVLERARIHPRFEPPAQGA